MVYAGPSRGCTTCKKRRIKCDEHRPQCVNCAKRRVPCPGVPDPPGIRFQDETEAVIQSFLETRGSETSESDGYSEVVTPNLGEDENFASLCFFHHNYMMTGRGIQSSRGLFEYLSPYYQLTDSDSLVSVATAALTATMFSLWRGGAPDSVLSRSYNGRAILLLKDTLKTSEGCNADTTLIAIIALQFREALIAHRKGAQVDGSHQHGAYALIKHRKIKGFHNEISKRLLMEVRNTMLTEAIRTRQPFHPDPTVWDDDGPMPFNPFSQLDRIAIDLANLQALYEQYKTTLQIGFARGQRVINAKDLSIIASFRRTATSIDQRFEIWANAQPSFYSPLRLEAAEIQESVRKAGLYGDFCNIYPTVQLAGVWHTFNSYRLILLKMMLCADQTIRDIPRENDVLFSESETWRKSAESTLQHCVDEICAAIPFHLGSRIDTAVDVLSNPDSVEFPWPPPDKDPYSNPSGPAKEYARAHNVIPLSREERTRQNICMGGYNILGAMAFVLGLAAEPLDLTGLRSDFPRLGSLLRQDQIPWLAGQMRRALQLHRVGIQDKSTKRPSTLVRLKRSEERGQPSDVAKEVAMVKKSMKYSLGV
jgi:hypothetical protein